MISDTPNLFREQEGTKRKHNDIDYSSDDNDDDELTLVRKRQKLNIYSLDISNHNLQDFSTDTAQGTDQIESASYTSLYGSIENERHRSRQGDAIAGDDTYWHLADHYYEAPSDEDDVIFNVNNGDNVDESGEDSDVSYSDYDGDDEISDSDAEDNNEEE